MKWITRSHAHVDRAARTTGAAIAPSITGALFKRLSILALSAVLIVDLVARPPHVEASSAITGASSSPCTRINLEVGRDAKTGSWGCTNIKGCIFGVIEVDSALEDELDKVERMGIRLVSEEEARQLDEEDERTIVLRDFDYTAIQLAFAAFGVDLDPDGLALAVFDHGNAPAGTSDRQFRFD